MPVLTLDVSERLALLQRFVRYVAVDTQSDEDASCAPSTEKQKDLARLLVAELVSLGCSDATMVGSGHVTATLPSNLPPGHPAVGEIPVLGFLAHLDTYHGTSGANVKPQVVHAYTGGDILLPATGAAITVAANPNLARCIGHTLIHSDGTTLLGADDKAGIAEIMTMLAWLGRHRELRHGTLRVAFTPDEEIGRGTKGFDLPGFGAQYAYTVDGADLGEVEDETFSADTAIVTITGHDVHPGYAKNVMINAVRAACAVVESLPVGFLPETTEGRQPYLHPYSMHGDVASMQLKLLVRAFSDHELREREDVLREILRTVEAGFPGVAITLAIQESYRNMGAAIAKDPKVVDYAIEAIKRQGLDPVRKAVRGGTDGSRLSAAGLLTPNLFAGGQAFHSVKEWVSLEWMAAAVGVCLQLISVWAEMSPTRACRGPRP